MIPFTKWPEQFARHYREQGYWQDLPLTDLLQQQAKRAPNKLALICGERRYTYAQLEQASERLAAQLSVRGLKAGDTAVVQLANVAEFYQVYFALLKIGVAAVFGLYSHQKQELRAYAEQVQARLLIADRAHKLFHDDAFIHELQLASPVLQHLVFLNGHSADEDLQTLLDDAVALPITGYAAVAADEVAFFQLSGGSTGTPKLIPRTHNDYYYSVRRSAEICQLGSHTRYLCALPAAHNYTLSSPGGLGVLYAGGCIVLAASPEPELCFALIRRHAIDMVALVPSALALWLRHASLSDPALTSLRLVQVGGASLAPSLAQQVATVFHCQLQQVFGMAEGLVNYTRFEDDQETLWHTQGRPMSEADEVEVRDSEGRRLGFGETGLLYTRGPYTFRGYFQAPAHNASVFDEQGFYCSGDLVQQDSRGYLRVVGRVKDQINRGGEKIAAEEIENLLLRHPEVLHAAVVGVADPLLGEKSCACVVLKRSVAANVLRRYLREAGIAEFKLPDRIIEMSALPLTAVGKTDKVSLRQRLQHATSVESVNSICA